MKRDKIDELLSGKLAKAEITPPDDVWARIESSMAEIDAESGVEPIPPMVLRRPTRRLNSRTVWGYVAAAAVMIGIITVGIENMTPDEQVVAQADEVVTEAIEQQTTVPVMASAVVNPVSEKTENIVRTRMAQQVAVSPATQPQVEERVSPNVEESVTEAPKQEQKDEETPKSAESIAEKPKSKSRLNYDPFVEDFRSRRKKKKSINAGLYAMNFSSGSETVNLSKVAGRSNLSFAVNEMLPNASDGLLMGATYTASLPELEHKMPLSFGLSLSFGLGNKFALESGIVYSRLVSEAKTSGAFDYNYKVKQTLQYLGIPVALRYDFVDSKTFKVYAKAGAMVEMAVDARYSETVSGVRSTTKIDADGVQASVQGAVGAQVNLMKGLGLYVEPGMAYYFDCGQPENYRTENPFNFALTAGLRVNFR